MMVRPRSLILAVFLGGVAVRCLRLVMNGPLWGDEAMQVRSLLDRHFAECFQPLEYTQLAPLGFLWAELAVSQWLGTSEWVWRLMPTVAGLAAMFMFWNFATRVLPRHAAWLSIGIMASSVYLVRHTVEAKPYIIDFTLALGLLQLGGWIQEQPARWSRWGWLGATATLAVWCSFPSVFAAGGILLGLLPLVFVGWAVPTNSDSGSENGGHSPPYGSMIAWVMCGVGLSASFVAMYFLFGKVQMSVADAAGYWRMSMWEVAYPPWQRPDLFLVWFLREHTGSMMAHPFGGKNFASGLTAVLVVVGMVTLFRRGTAARRRRLLWMLLAPALLGLLAACLRKYPYGGTARTMLYVAPAICLLAGLGAWSLMVRWLSPLYRRRAWTLVMIGCLGLIIGKGIVEVIHPYKERGDWLIREAIRTWAEEARPDDIWIVANSAVTPDQTDHSLFGGGTAAVFDHYVIQSRGSRAFHPRQVIDFPKTPGRVVVLVYEGGDHPLPVDIAGIYRGRFQPAANLISDEVVDLGPSETLRRMVFTGRDAELGDGSMKHPH